ncbi:MAG TPA: hypothetical protein VGJ54_10105 [Streptosporangiaceae bacterium]|jgi:hypothetical protein
MAPPTPGPLDDPGLNTSRPDPQQDTSPNVLDVPDTPDPFTDRDPSPRPADGPQDITQDPDHAERHGSIDGPAWTEA